MWWSLVCWKMRWCGLPHGWFHYCFKISFILIKNPPCFSRVDGAVVVVILELLVRLWRCEVDFWFALRIVTHPDSEVATYRVDDPNITTDGARESFEDFRVVIFFVYGNHNSCQLSRHRTVAQAANQKHDNDEGNEVSESEEKSRGEFQHFFLYHSRHCGGFCWRLAHEHNKKITQFLFCVKISFLNSNPKPNTCFYRRSRNFYL